MNFAIGRKPRVFHGRYLDYCLTLLGIPACGPASLNPVSIRIIVAVALPSTVY